MLIPVPPIFRKRRALLKTSSEQPAPPPPATDTIVSVTHDGPNWVLVVVDGVVVNVSPPTNGLWLYPLDGDPQPASDFELVGPSQVRFTFPLDVSEYLNWHVEDGAAWEMSDGSGLQPPYDGDVS